MLKVAYLSSLKLRNLVIQKLQIYANWRKYGKCSHHKKASIEIGISIKNSRLNGFLFKYLF